MKKFLSIFILLLLPTFCFGAISYDRTPSGSSISNPVNFEVSFSSASEMKCADWLGSSWTRWSITAHPTNDEPDNWYHPWTKGEWYSSTTLSGTFTSTGGGGVYDNLDLTNYDSVCLACCSIEEEQELCGCGDTENIVELEGTFDSGETIFSVVEASAGGVSSLIPPLSVDTTQIGANISGFVSGAFPYLALFLGLPLAWWIILTIKDLTNLKKQEKKLESAFEKFSSSLEEREEKKNK
jgi:hypothetical protein